MKFLAVTGTNGKTSATQFVKSILDGLGVKAGLLGTVYNQIGAETLPAARFARESLFEKMSDLRKTVDALESITPRDLWPFPTYGEMLYSVK